MNKSFTLDYWQDDGWFVGRLKEVPNVMSQGETLEELEKNINEAYQLLFDEAGSPFPEKQVQTKEIEVSF